MSRYLKYEKIDIKRVELDADTNRRVILPLDEQYEALRVQVTGADNVLLYINKEEADLIPENGILISDFDLEFKDLAVKKLALELYLPNEPIEPAPEEPIEPSEPEEGGDGEDPTPSEPENGEEGGDGEEPTEPTPGEPENGETPEEPTDPEEPETPEDGGEVEPLALVSDTDEIFCRSAKVQILLMK